MQTSFDRTALVLLSVFALFLVSPVSAEWNIDVLDQPYSFQNISNTSNTVQMVELTDGDGTPINNSQLVGDSYFQYNYNNSVRDMEWLYDGYWYADFQLNRTGGQIEFEAEGETQSSLIEDSTSETNATREFNLGNISVDLMNDFSHDLNPENSFDIKVNVTDTVNNTFEDQADVDLYFTNRSWTSEIYDINNKDDEDGDGTEDHYKNFGLDFNLDYNSTYVLHVNTTNTSDVGYNDSYGVQSMSLSTVPEIKGEIERLNASSGCNNESFFTECEYNTTIDTGFNITSASADNVNLTLELRDSSSGNWENHSTTELTEENGLYTGEIEVPDINTSSYDRVFRLQYKAANGPRVETVDRVVDYNDFKIVDKSDSVTGKGSYRVKLEIRKYFTPKLLTDSRINDSLITIDQPSGDLLNSFNVEDMERMTGSGYFKKKIDIPLNSETGIYDMEVEVTNIYNQTKLELFNFEVTETEQSFSINEGDEDFEKTVDKIGNHTFNVTVENKLDSETNISTNTTGDIENFTEVNNGENISLGSEESKNVSIRFDVGSVDEYDGEIKFMDENAKYNSTLDVELDHPSCSYRKGTVCVIGSSLNASSDEKAEIIKDFTTINFGEKNKSYSYSFSLSGNITSYASLETTETVLNTENDSETVDLTYSVNAPGFYSGTLRVDNDEDTVKVPLSLDSDVETTSTSIGLPSSIELGEVEEGESTSKDIEVENTGDIEVTGLEVSSEDYTVSADSTSIGSGSSETVSVEFSEVSLESGELTVTATTNSDSTTETLDVSASVIPDYIEKADGLEQRVIDLDSQVSSDSEYQTELNNVQSSISDLKSAYRQGNYDRAETLHSQVQSTLDDVEAGIRASSDPEDPGEQPDQTDEGGGIPILPIAAGIFVFLLVGFVAYTSIEFERGDPLYKVLGK
jgi:hypothetical protein